MRVKIITDSICDLPRDLLTEYNIRVIPLSIVVNGKASPDDGSSITPSEIFNLPDNVSAITSAINVVEYASVYSEELIHYDALVNITISGEISTCYQNAVIAAEGFPGKIFVVDSRALSTGTGLLALYAAGLAADGQDAYDIANAATVKRSKLETSFVIDTLKYLHKGGRCSSLAALGANLLSLKPCIEMQNGKLDVGKKYRGKIDKAIEQYISDRLAERSDLELGRIYITHTFGSDRKVVEAAKAKILELAPFAEVLDSVAGCTVSNHCGPGTLGIIFFRK
ncbi:MAG: DegV family protein [Oscillospiraceae bacterium]|jgi:DegV family protein with EDD domain|nr:DegV family protein [Oscillospiraceae bacterium]